MKPVIYSEKKHPERVYLVNADHKKICWLPKKGSPPDSPLYKHFMGAVEIGSLAPGHLSLDDSDGGKISKLGPERFNFENCSIRPRPCVLLANDDGFLESGISSKGIETQSAKVMLELAVAFNNVDVRTAYGRWEFGESHAERGAVRGFDEWLFFGAWLWSVWPGVDYKTRHSLMHQLGYPRDKKTLKTLLSRAGLIEKNRASNVSGWSSYH